MENDNLVSIFNEVHTERLLLRRPRTADSLAMFAVHGDPATNRYNPTGPDPDLATSEATLQKWVQNWEHDGYGYWVITRLWSEDVLGFGGVRRIFWCDRDVLNLYYRFIPSVWGQGYATEMGLMAVALARKHMPYLPIVARTREKNIASIRVAERVGLERRPDLDTEHIVFASGWRDPDSAKSGTK